MSKPLIPQTNFASRFLYINKIIISNEKLNKMKKPKLPAAQIPFNLGFLQISSNKSKMSKLSNSAKPFNQTLFHDSHALLKNIFPL